MANEIPTPPERYRLTDAEKEAQIIEAERQLLAARAAHPEHAGIYDDALATLRESRAKLRVSEGAIL